MAVSRNTEHNSRPTLWKRLFGQLTRYDVVLTVIPLVFVVAVVVGVASPVPFLGAVAGGAVLSGSLLVDALFFNPPISEAS